MQQEQEKLDLGQGTTSSNSTYHRSQTIDENVNYTTYHADNRNNKNKKEDVLSFGTLNALPPSQPQHEEDEAKSSTESSKSTTSTATATISSCVINLANTIVGAGMLGLPGAFGGTGYVGGTILLLMGATFSSHGLILLSKSALIVRQKEIDNDNDSKTNNNKAKKKKKHKQIPSPSSFYTVARAAVPQYTILIDLAVALKCFGVATGYLITVSDCMVEACNELIAELSWFQTSNTVILEQLLLSRQFWTTFGIISVLPLSFYTTLNSLHHASTMALIFVFFLILMIISYAHGWGSADPCWTHDDTNNQEEMAAENDEMLYYYSYNDNNINVEECRGEIVPFTSIEETFAKLPIFIFAFTCQQNIFPVVNELYNPIIGRLRQVVTYSIILALFVYMIVALEGYRTFGSQTKGDILLNYPETPKVTIMRICIAIMLTLHYPLQLDPSRRCFMSLMKVVQRFVNNKRRRTMQTKNDGTIIVKKTSSADSGDSEYDNDEIMNEVDDDNNHNEVGVTYYKKMSSTLEDGLTSQQRKEIELFHNNDNGIIDDEQNTPPFSHILSPNRTSQRLYVNERSSLSPKINNNHQTRTISEAVTEGYYGATHSSEANKDINKINNNDDQNNDHSRLFYGITGMFLLCSWMLAMIVDDLGVVLALVGATGSTLVSYVLPGLIYVQLHKQNDITKWFAYGQLILGLIIMPVALYFVLNGHLSH